MTCSSHCRDGLSRCKTTQQRQDKKPDFRPRSEQSDFTENPAAKFRDNPHCGWFPPDQGGATLTRHESMYIAPLLVPSFWTFLAAEIRLFVAQLYRYETVIRPLSDITLTEVRQKLYKSQTRVGRK